MNGYKNIMKDYYYGAASYPEVIDEKTFIKDIELMKKIGMNVVRIGEFFWSKLEPEEGVYKLDYLRKLLNILLEHRMNVIMGTPTPTPPRWFTIKYPDSLFVNDKDIVMEHGSRQQVCTNHPQYRKKAYQLTEKIAEVIKEYPNIIAVQLDNEFKCHVDACYCKNCQDQWQERLSNEYITIENLNKAWGTSIWSQEYREFNEIPVPRATPFLHNSSLQNSFRKFHTDTINEFAKESAEIIRKHTDVVITHNSALGFNLMNQQLFEHLDIAGFDTYASSENYPAYLMNIDLFRNIKGHDINESLLLETSTSHAGHIENYVTPHPEKYLQTEVFIGFAGGLRAFCYWHFRGHSHGVEQPHSSVITAWGEPGKGYDDVLESAELLNSIKPILEKTQLTRSKVGIIYSDEARRHFNIENGGKYQYRQLITDFYSFFITNGIAVELVTEKMDLSDFSTVYVPFCRHLDESLFNNLQNNIHEGATVVFGPMTSDRTTELSFPTNNGLEKLGDWLNIKDVNQYWQPKIEEKPYFGLTTSFSVDETWTSLLNDGERTIWAEKKIGKGNVYLIGAFDENYEEIKWRELLLNTVNIKDSLYNNIKLSKGLKLYVRENESEVYYFIANMSGKSVEFEIFDEMINAIYEEKYSSGIHMLKAYEYIILKKSKL